jgi:preprotein translocase subunit SecG
MMSNQMLIIFGLIVGRVRYDGDSGKSGGAEKALAVFCFFLFIAYLLFTIMLVCHHKTITQKGINSLEYLHNI